MGSIPLEKVFIKQRIDIMTAKAWLTEEKVLEQQVKAMSLEHGVPSVHTKLCAFEINPKKEAEMRQSQKSGGGAMNVAKYAAGGAAGVMVLGALAGASFGDVGASMSNAAAILPGAGAMLASIDFGDIGVPDLELPRGRRRERALRRVPRTRARIRRAVRREHRRMRRGDRGVRRRLGGVREGYALAGASAPPISNPVDAARPNR